MRNRPPASTAVSAGRGSFPAGPRRSGTFRNINEANFDYQVYLFRLCTSRRYGFRNIRSTTGDALERFAHNLDWNLLRTVVVVVEEGSITRAAGRLLLQQPAVSMALKRLEQTVGHRLIDRRSGRFELTDAGERLVPSLYRAAEDGNLSHHQRGRRTQSRRARLPYGRGAALGVRTMASFGVIVAFTALNLR